MNGLIVNDGMLKIKADIELVNSEVSTTVNDINTNLDSIVSNWQGNRSKKVLEPVERIKLKNNEIINKIKAKADEIGKAYETYLKNSETEIIQGENVTPIISTPTNTSEVNPNIESKDKTFITAPGFISPSSYVNDYLDQAINYVKNGNGANPFDNENMMSLSTQYNNTPNIRTQGEALFNDYNANLKVLETKLKENNLWGTPEGSSILMHYTIKTGFRIPTYPTTKTDGVGNYRHLGANTGWLNNNNGLDCNNILAWVAINSGRMAENQHVYVPESNSKGTILLGKKDLTGIDLYSQGIRPGDNAGRSDHATVFIHEDNDNIYLYESVSNIAATESRKLQEGGTMITVIPKNPNISLDNSISPKYPRSHINYFVPFESIQQYYNPADPSTIKK